MVNGMMSLSAAQNLARLLRPLVEIIAENAHQAECEVRRTGAISRKGLRMPYRLVHQIFQGRAKGPAGFSARLGATRARGRAGRRLLQRQGHLVCADNKIRPVRHVLTVSCVRIAIPFAPGATKNQPFFSDGASRGYLSILMAAAPKAGLL
jgi:hypothetical protein